NVTASTCPAATWPLATSWAIRCVMVRVLPVPAPASTQTGPRGASTASRCWSSSPAVNGSATIGMASILAAVADKPGAAPRVNYSALPEPPPGMHRRPATLMGYDQCCGDRLHDVMVWLLPSPHDGAQVQPNPL